MNPLIPGILTALNEERMQDAMSLVNALVEEEGAEIAVVQMAMSANLLHAQPTMSLKQLAAHLAMPDGIELATDMTNGQVALEILDVVEGWTDDGPSPEGREILDRFDHRPGSAEIMEMLCNTTVLLMSSMQLQELMVKMGRRSMASARRHAFDHARAVLSQEDPPNVFSAEYDDLA